MSTRDAYLRTLLAGCVVLQSLAPSVAPADPIFGRLGRLVHEATYHGVEPTTCEVGAIEELAENIDWLEHHIDKYGSVVAKQPDIWGEARLTKHRDEYERMMFGELNQFQFTINAAISQGDSAFLAQAIALSNAAAGATSSAPANPDAGAVAISVANAQLRDVDDAASTSFGRFGITSTATQPGVDLEPTLYLDQMSRYLQHLHELRRINEGDDTSDSPGYSLNLVRMPVSILPGKLTRRGFGAEVTVTCTPVLSDDLMPTTFRNLVINDVVQQLRLPVTRQSEAFIRGDLNPEAVPCKADLGTSSVPIAPYAADSDEIETVLYESIPKGVAGLQQSQISLARAGKAFGAEVMRKIACDFIQNYDGRHVRWNGWTAKNCGETKTDERRVELLDVQGWLDAETAAAYELLKQPEHVWLFAALASPSSKLASHIRGDHYRDAHAHDGATVEDYRSLFFQCLHAANGPALLGGLSEVTQNGCDVFGDATLLEEVRADIENTSQPNNSIESLAWALVVESALLNEHLNNDVRKLAKSKEVYTLDTNRNHWFFLPDSVLQTGNGLEPLQSEYHAATDVFQEYVKARWPIHVFAVDPREQDQNVADVSNRKREMQFALALGFATGKIGVNSLTQYSRELDTQIETISLNRTIVGFGHGADTFGWRFYPRVQALPVPGTLGVLRESFMGTSRDYDLKHRQLEPGARECVAIVLMPSFIPYADFDIRTNWFKLTNPKNAALTMKDSVRLSRAITAMHNSKAQCSQCAHLYREGEIDRLMTRVQQLDHELPLQSHRTLVPYENTLGGFEMFNTGVTDLAPQLIGWHGAPGVNIAPDWKCGCFEGCSLSSGNCDTQGECGELTKQVAGMQATLNTLVENGVRIDREIPLPTCQGAGTTLFLVGDNFSVHDTKVIAGGVCIPHVRLISREIMQVTIPHCVNTVQLCENGIKKCYVSVYVATPYGVTGHLHVPVINAPLGKQAADCECVRTPADDAAAVAQAASQAASADAEAITFPEQAEPLPSPPLIDPSTPQEPCGCELNQQTTDWSPWPHSDVATSPFRLVSNTAKDSESNERGEEAAPQPIEEPISGAAAIAQLSDSIKALADSTGKTDGAKIMADAIIKNGDAVTALSNNVGALAASPAASDGAAIMAGAISENGKAIAALSESIQALSDSTAALTPLPPVINVQVSPVISAPGCDHECDHEHPLLGQMKTHTMECWRNLRDQLPGY